MNLLLVLELLCFIYTALGKSATCVDLKNKPVRSRHCVLYTCSLFKYSCSVNEPPIHPKSPEIQVRAVLLHNFQHGAKPALNLPRAQGLLSCFPRSTGKAVDERSL